MTAIEGDRTAIARVAAAFAVQGLGFSVVVTNTAANKARFGFNDGTIALLALGICVGAFAGTRIAAAIARRAGSRRALQVGLLLSAVALALLGAVWLPSLRLVGIQIVATGVYALGLGIVDAATNMRAIALQEHSGRSRFVALHSVASLGSIVGALLVSVVVLAGWSAGVGFAIAAVLVVVVLALSPDAVRDPVSTGSTPGRGLPVGVLALLAVGVLAAPAADSLVSSWSAVFLAELVSAPAAVVPLGYAAYIAALVASRLSGDWLAARVGLTASIAGGVLVGAAGLVVLAGATHWGVALAALVLLGAGFGSVVPLVLMLAANRARAQQRDVDTAIAATNGFVYAGYVLSTVLVGVVAGLLDLRVATLAVLILVLPAAAVLPLARRQDSTANAASSSRPRSPSLG